jgi:hypothetical protein
MEPTDVPGANAGIGSYVSSVVPVLRVSRTNIISIVIERYGLQ